jgi:hypothetical protein
MPTQRFTSTRKAIRDARDAIAKREQDHAAAIDGGDVDALDHPAIRAAREASTALDEIVRRLDRAERAADWDPERLVEQLGGDAAVWAMPAASEIDAGVHVPLAAGASALVLPDAEGYSVGVHAAAPGSIRTPAVLTLRAGTTLQSLKATLRTLGASA